MEPMEMAGLALAFLAGTATLLKLLERTTDEQATDYEHQPH